MLWAKTARTDEDKDHKCILQKGLIPMKDIGPNDVMTFVWVGAAIIALVLTVWGLAEKIKKAYAPKHELEQW